MNELRLFNDLMDVDPFEGVMRNMMRGWRPAPAEALAPAMRVDVSEQDGAYEIKADLPGVQREDIEVRIDGRQVTLSAEVKQDTSTPGNGGRVLRSERRYGYSTRSFTLDAPIDEGKAEAHFRNGVLELKLPKKAGNGGGRKLAVLG